jgi:predicted transposase YdaD
MAQPYDITTRRLFERDPRDWLALAGFATTSPLAAVDPSLATLSATADKVVRVEADVPWLFHIELQASYDRALPWRLLRYNTLLSTRDELPVECLLLLLRPEADGPALGGRLVTRRAGRTTGVSFEYTVIRLWELSVESVLSGGLGTLPLAPLAGVDRAALPLVVGRVAERLDHEATPSEADDLWVATYTLFGLRYPEALADQLLRGVRRMRESVTYQAILEEGREEGRAASRVEEARALLTLLGEQRFGPPTGEIRATLAAIDDAARLEALARRLLSATGWDDLLGQA